MKRLHTMIGILGVVSLLFSLDSVRAADPARLVPQDSAIYVEISDASRIVDRLLAPDIVGMLEAVPQFKQLLQSDQFAQLRSVVSYLETRLDTNWRKAVGDLTGGGAVFAIKPGQPDFALLVIRAKDPNLLERANKLIIELAENDAKDKGKESPVKSKEYKGVMAWSIGKDEFHAIVGDTLVFSNKQEGIKTALEMNAGEGPRPITELAVWKEARGRAPADRVGWAFARLDMFRQGGVAKDFYQEKASNAALPILFGGLSHVLTSAEYGTASLVLKDDRLALRVEVPRDGKPWPEAYRGFYAAKPGEEAAVPLRPAHTIASLSFYRDFKSMWDARDQLVTADVLPQFTELENNVAQVLFGGREFANEVLGEIGPHIRIVAAAQDYTKSKIVPDIRVPAFALVLELKHPEDFGTELLVSYQSVMGLVNLGLGQQNQPRFILTNETHKGFQIQGARFLEKVATPSGETGVHIRHNFTPACTTAGRYFVLGSTVQIVKDVIDALGDASAPPKTTDQNIVLELDGAKIRDVLAQNKEPLVHQNMVGNGNTREQAEQEFGILLKVIELFSKGKLAWTAEPKSMHVDLSIDFAKAQKAAGK